jgi:hypothetical protein
MQRSIRPRQRDLFEEPPTRHVVTLPKLHRDEVVRLLATLLSEVANVRDDHPLDEEGGDEQAQR